MDDIVQDNGHEPVDNVVKFRRPDGVRPDYEAAAEMLAEFHEMAEKGELTHVCIGGVTADGRVVTGLMGGENIFEMIGVLASMQTRLVKRIQGAS